MHGNAEGGWLRKRQKETLREDGRDNKPPAYYTEQAYYTKRKEGKENEGKEESDRGRRRR